MPPGTLFGEKQTRVWTKMTKANGQTIEIKGTKGEMSPRYAPDGKRIVVTKINLSPEAKPAAFFSAGDKVKVTGWTKGRGFTGVMKRWGFKGGPRTHGQSDRARAPGSIGLGTTPGRVFKGKKMAGRSGNRRQTISGLKVFEISEDSRFIAVTGPIPGPRTGPIILRKVAASAQKGENHGEN